MLTSVLVMNSVQLCKVTVVYYGYVETSERSSIAVTWTRSLHCNVGDTEYTL